MKNGKYWVVALLAVGTLGGLVSVTFWKQPRNSVRGSFTLIHSSLVRNKKDAAIRLIAPRILWKGREFTAAEFVNAYALPGEASPQIDPSPCPSVDGHWTILMGEHRYCFVENGKLWQLHWLDSGPCRCRS